MPTGLPSAQVCQVAASGAFAIRIPFLRGHSLDRSHTGRMERPGLPARFSSSWFPGFLSPFSRSRDPALDPGVLAGDHLLRERVAVVVGIFADAAEIRRDARVRLRREIVHQHQHLRLGLAIGQ